MQPAIVFKNTVVSQIRIAATNGAPSTFPWLHHLRAVAGKHYLKSNGLRNQELLNLGRLFFDFSFVIHSLSLFLTSCASADIIGVSGLVDKLLIQQYH